MIAFLAFIALLAIITTIYLQHLKFGRQPDEQSLKLIQNSPNYRDGAFQNQSNTPDFAEGVTYYDVFKDFFFAPKLNTKPMDSIPSVSTDLLHLDQDKDVLIWFGHSSYFMRLDGKNILVDPVFSGNASPIPSTMKSFNGSDIYLAKQLPHIDYLIITHDHWDHLDYETILELNGKVDKIVCGLGVASHLRYWKINAQIFETDWFDTTDLDPGFKTVTTPARHFSGRTFKRN
ncbi:MBL fold metallo-hydrolase, partial [Pseudoxanthomonas sp. SGD-10]